MFFFQYLIGAELYSDYEKVECRREHKTLSIDALKVACQRANYGETVAQTHVFSLKSGKLTFCLFLEVLYSPHIIVA